MTINEIKLAIDEAQAGYLAIRNTGPAQAVEEAGSRVKQLKARLSAAITEGADPCPDCGSMPHGMEQPRAGGGFEYEVGCLVCGMFKHADGTYREHRVRGGMLPRHSVEAWNEGPDFWRKADYVEKKEAS